MENTEPKNTPNIEVAMPALLRHARTAYGLAIQKALAQAGYDDIPKNGHYVIGGLAIQEIEIPLGQLIRELRTSKQAAGQLVDTLVLRGYLERKVDPDDRRKLSVTLTERGRAAAELQRNAIKQVDAELLAQVSAEDICCTRRTLFALIRMTGPHEEDGAET